jgi:hypothetical protein
VPYAGEGEGLHLPPVPETLNLGCSEIKDRRGTDFFGYDLFSSGYALIALLYCPMGTRTEISCAFQRVNLSER